MAEMTAERAIEKYGATAQRRQMIEEMAELTQALCKMERVPESPACDSARNHVLEEIADVQIMLNQMQLLYGDCTDWEIKKLERLAWRMGMEARDDEAI